MGNEVDNVNQANTEKATYDKTVGNMKIGVCEMQGWRRTMEDAAIVLPNFEKIHPYSEFWMVMGVP